MSDLLIYFILWFWAGTTASFLLYVYWCDMRGIPAKFFVKDGLPVCFACGPLFLLVILYIIITHKAS